MAQFWTLHFLGRHPGRSEFSAYFGKSAVAETTGMADS
jgi:hypothetical protein